MRSDSVARLSRSKRRHIALVGLVTATVWVALSCFVAPSATAELGVIPTGEPGGFISETATTNAGAPADDTVSFDLNPQPVGGVDGGLLKDVVVDFPPGLIGNPEAVPKCTTLQTPGFIEPQCPVASQVGTVDLRAGIIPGLTVPLGAVPLYNMVTPKGVLADFGFIISASGVPEHITASLRPGDYGVRVTTRNASQFLSISGVTAHVWGVPADPVHDAQRCPTINLDDLFLCDGTDDQSKPHSSGAPRKPFFVNPTSCGGALLTTVSVSAWADRNVFASASTAAPAMTRCDRLSFDPGVEVSPDTTRPDAPTGLSVDLTLPQSDNPDGLASAHLKDAVITLPEGLTVNPSSADGLGACTDGQLQLGNDSDPTCPESAKIGTAQLDTPVLAEPVEGSVYLGSQRGDQLLRLFLVLKSDQYGLLVKLRGNVDPDPVTGRLTTTFVDNPQLPFGRLHLRFKSGPRAPLATPTGCGATTAFAQLTSWGGQQAAPADGLSIDCPGMTGFAPAFTAGLKSSTAGAYSPFVLRVDRQDGQEFIDGIDVRLPTGLLAKIKDVPLCSDADASAGTCPGGSRVGTATVGAGPGPTPFFLPGSVSLTKGYKGAPYGLSIAVRAIAGPLDLGMVVVRQAVFIDPVDAHITVKSDPLPTILKGIPLRLRTVGVAVDRPTFMTAPTSCARKQIRAGLHSQQGHTAAVAAPFQASDCQALPLRPRTTMRLTGRREMSNGRHPGLDVTLEQARGQAHMRKVQATLPLSLALDPDNANALCEFEDGLKSSCPARSIIGRATAVSPLLNHPLTGAVYFVKGIRFGPNGRRIRTLPTLLVQLRGELDVDLRAKSTVSRGRLVTTFEPVPDAAISRFHLQLKGGKGGILTVTNVRSLCGTKPVTALAIDGQNGKQADQAVPMKPACAATKRRGK